LKYEKKCHPMRRDRGEVLSDEDGKRCPMRIGRIVVVSREDKVK
jgi:hypothetical protein